MKIIKKEYNKVKYLVIQIDDKIKRFIIYLLRDKRTDILSNFFRMFLNQSEHEKNRCTRLRMNNDDEFFNNKFDDFRFERDIKIEFIIIDNF